MARTQLRLDAVSGSYSSAEIDQAKAKQAAYASYASGDMNDVMSDMASAIKRIHGADFASQDAGVFSHAITGSAGLKVAGDIDANGTSDFAGAMVLQAGITVAGVSKLDGAVDANSTSNFQGAMVLQSTLDVDGAVNLNAALDVDGVSTLASAVIEGAASVGAILTITGAVDANSTSNFQGAMVLQSTLEVDGASTLASALVEGALEVDGISTLASAVIEGAASVGAVLTITGAVDANSTSNFQGAMVLQSTLDVDGAVNLNGVLDVDGVATLASAVIEGAASVGGNLTVTGDLIINGSTTTVNSTTLTVDDKNIELGATASPDETSANGGGITLKGLVDKTILWHSGTQSWQLSEHLLPSADATKDLGSVGKQWRDLKVSRDAAIGQDISVIRNATVGGTFGATGVATFTAAIDANSTSDFQGAMNLQAGLTVAGVSSFAAVTGSAGLKLAGDGDFNGAVAFAGTFALDSLSPQVINKTGGDLVIKTSADLYFHDQYRSASTWSSLDGVKLAATAAEWSAFETAAGSEASILGAIGLALAGSGGGKGKWSEVIATDAANGQVTFSPSPLFAGIADQAGRIDVYLNGQMMSADDYALSGAAVVDFVFGLKVDDVVTVVIR